MIKVKVLKLVVNFQDFWQNNSIFMQKNNAFKNSICEKKFIFHQLTANFSGNFAHFQRISSVFMKKKVHLKILAVRKVHVSTFSPEFC